MMVALILLCLLLCILLASLAEAIRGLDPETLAVPDELEDDEEQIPIVQVAGRFRAAENQLRAGAIIALGVAAYLTGDLGTGNAGTVTLVLLAGLVGVIVGTLIPGALVHGREAAVLSRSTRLVLFLGAALRPATAIQGWLATLLSVMFGSKPRIREERESPARPAGPPTGALETVLSFAVSTVDEVMTPRADMVVLERGARVSWVAQLVGSTRHARYPVYRGSLDEVIGVVSIRDLLGEADPAGIIDPLVGGLRVLPESKRCWELALEMQATGEAMALVVDEFGAVSGLVTPSDLLAELVGEIAEEGEPAPDEFRRLDLQTWVLNPFLRIDRVNELTGLGLPDGDYQTLAGFILTELGRIPAPRERLRWGDGEIEILAADRRRIELVRLRMGRGKGQVTPAGDT